MSPNTTIHTAVLTGSILVPAIAILAVAAIVLLRTRPDIRRWVRKWQALWTFYKQMRRRHRIIDALQVVDALLSPPDPPVKDAAELRDGIQRLLAVTAAEHLAQRAEVGRAFAPPPKRGSRRG